MKKNQISPTKPETKRYGQEKTKKSFLGGLEARGLVSSCRGLWSRRRRLVYKANTCDSGFIR